MGGERSPVSVLADPALSARFDSSVGRGDFVVDIGVGKLIKGKLLLCLLARSLRFVRFGS